MHIHGMCRCLLKQEEGDRFPEAKDVIWVLGIEVKSSAREASALILLF